MRSVFAALETSSKRCSVLQNRYLRNVPKRKIPVPKTERRLNVTILGTPNAGKSTLLNCLVRNRLAACTQKSHTTRANILGVFNHRNIQLAFYDTPGFVGINSGNVRSDYKIMRNIALEAAFRSDIILLVVDAAKKLTPAVLDTFAEMAKVADAESSLEMILILNKIDLVENKYELLETTHTLVSLINGVTLGEEQAHLAKLDTTTFMVSASKNDGVNDLKNYMLSLAPVRKWSVAKEHGVTSMSREERIEEMVRQSVMLHTHDEVPYIAGIECASVSSLGRNRLKIEVDIYVNTKAQARIVVGAKGRTMVKIRQESVVLLEDQLHSEIILYLYVKVRGERFEDEDATVSDRAPQKCGESFRDFDLV